MKKRVMAMVMALCLALSLMPVSAGAVDGTIFQYENIYYHVIDDSARTVEVIHSSGQIVSGSIGDSTYSGAITIPAKVLNEGETYTVIGIGERAFFHASNLTSITLPDGLQYIDSGTFNGSGLTTITIPASVTRLGGYGDSTGQPSEVFAVSSREPCSLQTITFATGSQLTTLANNALAGCDSLSALEIPAGVTDLGLDSNSQGNNRNLGALNGWVNAKNVTFAQGSPFENVDGILYKGDTFCVALDDTITSVTVREGTKEIGDAAFFLCKNLANITLPDGLEKIGDGAFNFAPLFGTSIPGIPGMPGGITIPGAESANVLNQINIPATVTEVGADFLKGALKENGTSLIIMQGTTPPVFTDTTLFENAENGAKIIYPESAQAAYESSALGSYIDSTGSGGDQLAYSLTLTPASASVTVSGTAALTVESEVPTDAELSISNNNSAVASIQQSGNTITVTGVSAGTATITASITLNGVPLTSAACTVTVNAAGGTGTSSGGSSSGPTTYSPTLDVSDGGSIKVSPRTPEAGDEVTITPDPDSGYEVDQVTVTDRDGDEIRVTANRDGTYTFTQPRGRVTIAVTFVRETGETTLSDVPETYWAYDEIQWAYENGYVNGTSASTFAPGASISRQQVWMILARLSGAAPADMAAARAWAMETGVSDGTNPGAAVTRQQLAALLFRFAQANGYDDGQRGDLSRFPDAGSAASYAVEPLQWATAGGILNGTSQGTLNPAGTATRAQFAVMLYRFWNGL